MKKEIPLADGEELAEEFIALTRNFYERVEIGGLNPPKEADRPRYRHLRDCEKAGFRIQRRCRKSGRQDCALRRRICHDQF